MALLSGQMRGYPGFEAGARAAQTRRGGAEWHVQGLRNFWQRKTFQLVEHEHFALLGGKACERLVEPASALSVLEQRLGVVSRALLVERVRRILDVAGLAPPGVGGHLDRDAEQVRTLEAWLDVLNALRERDEDALRVVVRAAGVHAQPAQSAPHAIEMLLQRRGYAGFVLR